MEHVHRSSESHFKRFSRDTEDSQGPVICVLYFADVDQLFDVYETEIVAVSDKCIMRVIDRRSRQDGLKQSHQSEPSTPTEYKKNDSSFLSVLAPLRENPDRESAPVTPTPEEPAERLPKMQNR
jgi:hypothetical protein